MPRRDDGSRDLPLSHISIRAPWHDDGRNGCTFKNPQSNTACQALAQIQEADVLLCKDNADDLPAEQRLVTGVPAEKPFEITREVKPEERSMGHFIE